MLNLALLLLAFIATGACLVGLGVGEHAMKLLFLSIFIMIGVAFLIARPFLKGQPPRD